MCELMLMVGLVAMALLFIWLRVHRVKIVIEKRFTRK